MCQFLYSEGAAWKRSRQLCFPRMPEAGVKRQQGASVRRWSAVSPPRCPCKSPCGGCYLHAAREAMEAGGCPVCQCQAKLSIACIFQAPFDRLYGWMLHSNKVPTAFSFYIVQRRFLNPSSSCTWRKIELVNKHDLLQIFASSFLNQFSFFPLFLS